MADDEVCPKCNQPVIAECGGRGGWPVERDDLSGEGWRQCPWMHRRAMRAHLGPEIVAAPRLAGDKSPLFMPDGSVDLTTSNIFIRDCRWYNFLPHLKWALVAKGLMYRFLEVDDNRVKEVYVGDESYKHSNFKKKKAGSTNNNLSELLGSDFDLVIIRLGFLGHKNRAAPGALKEALMHRELLDLPTWLLEGPEHEWDGAKCHTYDADVAVYIETHFDDLRIPGGSLRHDEEPEDDERPTGNPDEDFIEVETPNETPNETPFEEAPEEPVVEDSDEDGGDDDYDPLKDSVL